MYSRKDGNMIRDIFDAILVCCGATLIIGGLIGDVVPAIILGILFIAYLVKDVKLC